jgi:hypothetical protein
MKRLFLFAVGFCMMAFPEPGSAQAPAKAVTDRSQVWVGYFNQTRMSSKLSLWLDLHARRTDFLDRWATTIIRPGLTYHLSDHARVTAGYAYASHWPGLASQQTVRPEHRLWQQISWGSRSRKLQLNQWIRLEERFLRKIQQDALLPGHNFNYKARYMIALLVPLKGDQILPGVPFAVLNDEVHINFGKEVVYNYFDQNRLFAGLGYQFTKTTNVQLGYMRVFQQQPGGNTFSDTQALRLFVFQNLDFRKPKKD